MSVSFGEDTIPKRFPLKQAGKRRLQHSSRDGCREGTDSVTAETAVGKGLKQCYSRNG